MLLDVCRSVFVGKLLLPSSGCESTVEAVCSSESLASLDWLRRSDVMCETKL